MAEGRKRGPGKEVKLVAADTGLVSASTADLEKKEILAGHFMFIGLDCDGGMGLLKGSDGLYFISRGPGQEDKYEERIDLFKIEKAEEKWVKFFLDKIQRHGFGIERESVDPGLQPGKMFDSQWEALRYVAVQYTKYQINWWKSRVDTQYEFGETGQPMFDRYTRQLKYYEEFKFEEDEQK